MSHYLHGIPCKKCKCPIYAQITIGPFFSGYGVYLGGGETDRREILRGGTLPGGGANDRTPYR